MKNEPTSTPLNNDQEMAEKNAKSVKTELAKSDSQTNKRRVWKTGTTLVYKSEGNKWFEFEMDRNEITHSYQQVAEANDEVILFDIDRHFYIKPTSDHIYFGYDQANVNQRFNNGNWVEFTAWKVMKQDVYFKKVDRSRWEKCVNGVTERACYLFIKSEGDEVVLEKTGIFFKLNWRELLVGPSLTNFRKECEGSWSSLDLIRL
jgi:hypothetical protein